MATLLLRLCAPLQAWDTHSHFGHRDTGREPSKSGVIGLLCAALGRPRQEPVNDLVKLRMGVRVDQEGDIRKDYHTAGMGGVYKVSGGVKKDLVTSERFYLADAKFLVGLEGDPTLLQHLETALQNPVWFLFLGRKACIPSERVWMPDGLKHGGLEWELAQYPWLGYGPAPARLRTVVEDPNGPMVRDDHVLSFASRRFLPRRMRVTFIETPQLAISEEDV